MAIDRVIAFAAGIVQSVGVRNVNPAARIFDQASFLKTPGDKRDAASLHGKHLGQELLRQREIVASSRSRVCRSQRLRRSSNVWAALQAATCWTCAKIICSCRTNDSRSVSLSSASRFSAFAVADQPCARDLADGLIERDRAVEKRGDPDHPVSAENASFDELAVRQADHERHHAAVRENRRG